MILSKAGLPGVTKDELKKIVICHVTTENAVVCMTKVGHVNTLSFKKINCLVSNREGLGTSL